MHIDDLPQGSDPVHLLIIGDSKTGKSTYTADAILAGFNVIYFDSDNGLSALRYKLGNDVEAKKRLHYFPIPRNPDDFLRLFLKSANGTPFRWVPSLGIQWGPLLIGITPETEVWEFDSSKVPAGWILAQDSWSSVASAALGIASPEDEAKLLEGTDQSIYGEANSNLTYICNMLQKVPYHCIVQAHGTRLEVYEKPKNLVAGQAKQKDMILRETKDVPWSSSRPHGEVMASRFNHIGWLSVNGGGGTDIDFMRKDNRIGGGPPNKKGTTDSISMKVLTKGVGDQTDPHNGAWWKKTTHGELRPAKSGGIKI